MKEKRKEARIDGWREGLNASHEAGRIVGNVDGRVFHPSLRQSAHFNGHYWS